jgi:hypothetical protein
VLIKKTLNAWKVARILWTTGDGSIWHHVRNCYGWRQLHKNTLKFILTRLEHLVTWQIKQTTGHTTCCFGTLTHSIRLTYCKITVMCNYLHFICFFVYKFPIKRPGNANGLLRSNASQFVTNKPHLHLLPRLRITQPHTYCSYIRPWRTHEPGPFIWTCGENRIFLKPHTKYVSHRSQTDDTDTICPPQQWNNCNNTQKQSLLKI